MQELLIIMAMSAALESPQPQPLNLAIEARSPKAKNTCQCSPQCECGCQDGQPCTCGEPVEAKEAYQTVQYRSVPYSSTVYHVPATRQTYHHQPAQQYYAAPSSPQRSVYAAPVSVSPAWQSYQPQTTYRPRQSFGFFSGGRAASSRAGGC